MVLFRRRGSASLRNSRRAGEARHLRYQAPFGAVTGARLKK
jgi:hypothetical protein